MNIDIKGKNFIREDRPLQPIRKVVVKGAVDVIFRRFDTSSLTITGETQEAIDSVRTTYRGDKLIIEHEGMSITIIGNNNIQIAAGRNIYISGQRISGNTIPALGKVIVTLSLPEAPAFKIRGSSDVVLLELNQAALELEIQGSGNITASGKVEHLNAEIAGSGDIDASELIADQANLFIAGSGDITAFVRTSIKSSVMGSGNIVVHGNPAQRDKSVMGSGKIKFR